MFAPRIVKTRQFRVFSLTFCENQKRIAESGLQGPPEVKCMHIGAY